MGNILNYEKYYFNKIFNIIDNKENSKLSKSIELIILFSILLSFIEIILESVPSINTQYFKLFNLIEKFCIIVFTFEYLIRLVTANIKFNSKYGILKFIFSLNGLIDLLAILPFFLPFIGIDLRLIRIFRIFRILRVFKLTRYIKSFELIKQVINDKKSDLIVSFILLLFTLIFVSSIMYYVENPAQPDKFSSIPATLWWGISTLTTVGYGDIYPITTLGKILSAVVTIIGIGIFTIPTGILAAGFTEILKQQKEIK